MPDDAVRELDQLAGHARARGRGCARCRRRPRSPCPTSETSTPAVKPAELLADDLGDLFGPDVHRRLLGCDRTGGRGAAWRARRSPASRSRSARRRARTCRRRCARPCESMPPSRRGSTRVASSTSLARGRAQRLPTARCLGRVERGSRSPLPPPPRRAAAFHMLAYAAAISGSSVEAVALAHERSSRRSRSSEARALPADRGHQLLLAPRGRAGLREQRCAAPRAPSERGGHRLSSVAQRRRVALLARPRRGGRARSGARRSGAPSIGLRAARGSGVLRRGRSVQVVCRSCVCPRPVKRTVRAKNAAG